MTALQTASISISTRASDIDFARVHQWLSQQSHWARGMPRSVLEKAIAHSLCFSAFASDGDGEQQVGFARVVSDRATFAYLCDVFVHSAWRGRGVGQQLMQAISAHAELQGLRRFALVTTYAHRLYERFGFTVVAQPMKWMERVDPHAYAASDAVFMEQGAAYG